jgi:hypothetical protein
MSVGWLRVFALVPVALLMAEAQCMASCAAGACTPAQASFPGNCHHHGQVPRDGSHCPYQHSVFASPEDGAALASAPVAIQIHPVTAELAGGPMTGAAEPVPTTFPSAAPSPPFATFATTISVLRI